LIFGGEVWGGQLMLTTMVDNFPGFPEGIMGPDLMEKFKQQVVRFGAEFVAKNVQKVDFSQRPFKVWVEDQQYSAKSVLISTGAYTLWLGVEGEKELIGRGVSSCAPCDAPFFRDKTAAVVGGGDSAMEEAWVLSKYATKVTIIHRRDAFRASEAMQKKVLENPKIEVLWNTEVVKVLGQQKVTGLKLLNNQTKKESEFSVDGVFVAIGHKPSSDIFKGQIDMDEKGFIKIADYLTKTNVDGVFVAGDVADPRYKQAVTAAGKGAAAALDILKYLDEN